MEKRYNARLAALEIGVLALGLLFLSPFYFVIVNSFKTLREILLDAARLPEVYRFENYRDVWEIIHFPQVFLNSLMITTLSVACIVAAGAMAGYRLARRPTAFNRFVFVLLVSAMIIPFQSIMLQLVRVTSLLELRGNLFGIVASYLGFGLPMAMFLFHGFVRSTVPLELEEAAIVDGCSPFGVFWKIVFPMLRPVMVTVVILNTLWIWNDYLLPVLISGGNKELTTIPLAVTRFFGQYTKQWDLALAGLAIAVAPVILFFLLLQKRIVEGVAAGSLKG